MEQRNYQGNVASAGLAEYLAAHYAAQPNMGGLMRGQGDSWVVQIRNARPLWGNTRSAGRPTTEQTPCAATSWPAEATLTTIGIHRVADDDLRVTMVTPPAISPRMTGTLVLMGVFSLVVWPMALFLPVWLISAIGSHRALRTEIWDQVQVYVMSQGGLPSPAPALPYAQRASVRLAAAHMFAEPAPQALPASGADAPTQKLTVQL